jgi:hypothetical protein
MQGLQLIPKKAFIQHSFSKSAEALAKAVNL